MVDINLDIKFVVVDDDIDWIRMHRELIRDKYPENKIYEFINGFEACSFLEAKALGSFEPSEWVVISDFNMPIRNGDEVMKVCEKNDISKRCIVSSANPEKLKQLMSGAHVFKKKIENAELKNWLLSL